MSLALWNLIRAVLVAGPNLLISRPGEPLPVLVMMKPFVLRNFWRSLTSSSTVPRNRSLVKRVFRVGDGFWFGFVGFSMTVPGMFRVQM